ncbi:MAG: hypothetical protein JKY37_09445 [Nannocystaceae bacterium]|nr:hypothetical protein [Nannocystaceae bacterium]
MWRIGLVLLLVPLSGCGDDRLRVSGREVRGPGFRITIPAGYERQPAKARGHHRVVRLVGPSGQFEAPTITHSEVGPTHALSEAECQHAGKDQQKVAGIAATMGARASSVNAPALTDGGVLGSVCGFTVEDRARVKVVRRFFLKHQGWTVWCEADEREEAETLCDVYLGSAAKPGRPD